MKKNNLIVVLLILIIICFAGCENEDDENDNTSDEDGDSDDDDDTSDDDDDNDDTTDDDDDTVNYDPLECGEESCYDPDSGLTWQNPPAEDEMYWNDANDYCDNLSLDGSDDWHLPTISELRSLIRGCPATMTGGDCGTTDSCPDYPDCYDADVCWSCSSYRDPHPHCFRPDELEGSCSYYWSSTPSTYHAIEGHVVGAWSIYFTVGSVEHLDIGEYDIKVRCVKQDGG